MECDFFTIETSDLLVLGCFDEFYDLYIKLSEIADDEFSKIDNAVLEHGCRINNVKMQPIIDKFLRKYTCLFTDGYEWLHPDKEVLEAFRMIEVIKKKRDRQYIFWYKVCSFKFFLYEFGRLVVNCLYKKVVLDKPKFKRSNTDRIVREYFDALVKKANKERYFPELVREKCKDIQEVRVFKSLSNVSCVKNKHYIVTENLLVKLLGKDAYVNIPVHKCLECKKIFIGEESLKLYEEKYGLTVLFRNYEEYRNHKWYACAKESQLYKTGYNADSQTWTEKERQNILRMIMDEHIMEGVEIKRDLENAIRRFKNHPNFVYAIDKWKKDLLFVDGYCLKHGENLCR